MDGWMDGASESLNKPEIYTKKRELYVAYAIIFWTLQGAAL